MNIHTCTLCKIKGFTKFRAHNQSWDLILAELPKRVLFPNAKQATKMNYMKRVTIKSQISKLLKKKFKIRKRNETNIEDRLFFVGC